MDPHFAEQNLGAGLGKIWAEFSALRAERDAAVERAEKLERLLNGRDKFIVDNGLWAPLVASLPATEGGDSG